MLRIISGHWRHHRLHLPPPSVTRPTTDRVREALFNILAHGYALDFKGLKVLDAFAGSGALGLEALSRGAESVYFMENHPQVSKVLKANIDALNAAEGCRILKGSQVPIAPCAVDLVFLDPPYHQQLALPTCAALQKNGWLKPATLICLETSPHDVPAVIAGLVCDQQRKYGQSVITFWRHELTKY
ncbi:16S rRNA (guanine(966)-N(2))-methyltransferase RsmD [Candidatus Finniella inopinata]|uniref:16S rRNA (Guanine(966)-N(2))-methyltransferase RsmD n=1 Tax=Candidatus Finniella inopinata TaxID=1696036 RepID=A0A4Q7DHA1_9PROT|nr:16S rRNA (guanine(966)-N(2))-methyltransferase RsmD [Candidatus Finniella inopinata]RZI45700.1 16S rRNA (guanine(966)-N(2))-methyltransferase RsmD [Candidatus Finniella inopinata]